jgi:outer membrane protein OmpA-like peptidoglycan-associated protein
MSTLHNSAKNKNKIITNLLRADNLKPYCQKNLKISINKDNKLPSTINNHTICGTIDNGFVTELNLEFEDENDEVIGPFNADFNNTTKKWCLEVEKTPLEYGQYNVKAIAKDYVINEAIDTQLNYSYFPYLNAAFDDENETSNPFPKICGDTNSDSLQTLSIILQGKDRNYGSYDAIIDNEEKTWCVDVLDKLPNGKYKLEGIATNDEDQNVSFNKDNYLVNAQIEEEEEVEEEAVEEEDIIDSKFADNTNNIVNAVEIPGLYDALMNEFKDDFDNWNAHLDKNTLVFRFKDPRFLFEKGSKNLKIKFKNILDEFYPRYLSIVKNYKDSIENIIIEGHSSSEHGGAKTKAGKYKLNQILSQQRANHVLDYANMILDDRVINNIVWIVTTFKAQGMSSSQLIYNEDETENRKLSRRVEFRIQINKNK